MSLLRLVWPNDPESYAGGSAANGRVTQAGQVKSDGSDKKGHPGPPGWGVGRGGYDPTPEKTYVQKTSEMHRTG